MNILVLDDFKTDREMLAQPFRAYHDVRCASDLDDVTRVLEHWWPDVALVDAIFPKKQNGPPVFAAEFFLELLERKRSIYMDMPQIIIVSGQNETAKRFDEVRQWLKYGRIADVIPKSTADIGVEFFRAVVQLRVETLLDRLRWRGIQNSAESTSDWFAHLGIVTRSPRVLALKVDLIAAARSTACVLLSGPTGCGKELFAGAIHKLARPGKPFKEADCSQIPTELFESEMFGIKEWGKNNAPYSWKLGLFEAVEDGTLHLDEIQDLKWEHQGKLRHVLQERKFRPVGATDDTPFFGKFVAATNKDLRENVEKGSFREDLYFRISAFGVQIPALADRLEDIPHLAEHFLKEFVRVRRAEGDPCPDIRLHPNCQALLLSFNWPGNVRQLRSTIEKAAEYALVECSESEAGVVISPDQLVHRNPFLGAVPPQISRHDALLASSGIGVQRWSDLTEDRTQIVAQAIEALLSDKGKEQFESMVAALRPRAPEAGPNAPGRDNQDPATIHCLKALLYLLLRNDKRASIQDLLVVLGLGSWASGKKVMKVLAGEDAAVPGFAPFLKLPSRNGRHEAELLSNFQRPDVGLDTL
jgi:DNA-binding NtrC family response regulator